ncbi:MAG: glycosyltransferase [Gammaproteobacteria bacterium]|nr:glycosyltransferase [Gammaproteobacteria bacterium]
MTRGRLYVATGPDWGRHPNSLSHIMRIVAEREPVVWINSMAQRAPRWSRSDLARAWTKAVAALTSRTRGHGGWPIVVHPRAVPYHQFGMVRALNGWLVSRQLQPVLARFPDRDVVFIATNPAAVSLIGRLRPAVSIYFCMDDYAAMHDSDSRVIEVCERLMLTRADATIVTSLELAARKGRPGRQPVYMPQGVDLDHFRDPGPVPAALADLPRPIIGFQGIVGPRVDIALFEKILRRFPEASLVTVGKEEVDLSSLRQYPNFHGMGAVPYESLPQWIQAFDVGLVAYKPDAHVASVNPLKLLEYLAMGQAVVSTDMPEMARHRDMVEIATDHAGYLAAIARVLAQGPKDPHACRRRKAYAAAHDWRERAGRLRYLCDELLSGRTIYRTQWSPL